MVKLVSMAGVTLRAPDETVVLKDEAHVSPPDARRDEQSPSERPHHDDAAITSRSEARTAAPQADQ